LIKERTGETNREMGGLFGRLTYLAVAKIYRNVIREMRGNRKPRRTIVQIEKNLDTFRP